GPYSSQWQAAMDAEMASWKSTGTYVDAVPPPGANIVSGMWIFRMKRPPGSPPVFKARYVARGFSQRQGVDYFQTFSPTTKMTTLRVLLHVAAHRDYELHSLDFSTAFLQGSLHEEIWLRRPLGFTWTFPPGTQWSLRRPVYGLRQAPREWHDTMRTTLAALGFAPSTADPSLFLRTDTSLPPFYILVYVDDLVFATADTAGLAHVKSELQNRHTCTDLEPLPPQGPAPSVVSQVDPLPGTAPVKVAVGSGAARDAASGGAASRGAEPGGADSEGAGSGGAELGGEEPKGAEPWGSEPEGVEPGGAESEGAKSGGVEPGGAASSGGLAGASPRLSPQQLRAWLVWHARLRSGATGAGGARDTGARGACVPVGAGGTGGDAAASPGGARTRGTGAAGTSGVGDAGAGDPTELGAAGAGGAGVEGTGAGGAGAAGAGAVDPGAGGAAGTVRPRPYLVPLLQQVLGFPFSTSLTPTLLCPLPAPSPYTE
ncbi:unnamed protein product, partial [Closterium sp. NIES-54]